MTSIYAYQLTNPTGIVRPNVQIGLKRQPTAEDMLRWGDAFKTAMRGVPDEWLVAASTPLYAFCALTWDWAETIIEVSAAERRDNKKVCREIRALRAGYDKFRVCVVGSELSRKEMEVAEYIDDITGDILRRFGKSASLRLSEAGAPKADLYLHTAVLQTLTALKAVGDYADHLDRELVDRWGAPKPRIRRSFVQDEVLMLSSHVRPLISDSAMAAARAAVDLAARQLVEELIAIEERIYKKATKDHAENLIRS